MDRCFYTVNVKVGELPTEEQLKKNLLPVRDDLWELFDFIRKNDVKAIAQQEEETNPTDSTEA